MHSIKLTMLSLGMIGVRIMLIIVWVHSANSYGIAFPRFDTADDAYLGCFYDYYNPTTGYTNTRVLPLGTLQNDKMTIETCITHCVELQDNITYAGLEAGTQCFCGTADADYDQGGLGRRPDEDCLRSCAGNVNQTCGDDRSIAVYNLTLILCEVPETENLLNSADSVPVLMNATFQCQPGYTLSGTNASDCIFDDNINGTRWEPDLPSCISVNPIQSTTPTGSSVASTVTHDYSSQRTTAVYDNTGTTSTETKGFVVGASAGVAAFGVCIAVVLVIKCFWKRSKEGTSHAQSQQAKTPTAPFYETIDDKGPCYATVNMDSNRSSVHSGDGDVSLHGSVVNPKGQTSTPVYSYADVTIDSTDVGNVVIHDRRAGDETSESGWIGNEAYSTMVEDGEQKEGWNENVIYTSE